MAMTAKRVGVPKDALLRFLAAGYGPQPKQMLFHGAARSCDREDGPTEAGYGGVRGESKSHAAIAQVALDDCQRFPGLKFLWLRKVGHAVRESFEDIRAKIFARIQHDYRRGDGVVEFERGSKIILGHYKDEKDIDNYVGLEYDGLLIEEANQLTKNKHEQIATCLRTSKEGWRPRAYFTFNPGGVGHAYLKEKFIQPWRANTETETRFVFAARGDNKFIDPTYQTRLDKLTGWLRAAWREGDWDIAAGQFFTTWRHDIHVKKLPVGLPAHMAAWASLDYGYQHPTVSHLLSEYDGITFVWDEFWAQKQLVPQNAEEIKQMLAGHSVALSRLRNFPAGSDCFAQRGDQQGKTIANQYAEHGIYLTPANTDRIQRAATLLKLLGDVEHKIPSRIVISDRCVKLIECIPLLQHDPLYPEKVLKVNVDEDGNGGDDPYDSVGYGIMSPGSEGIF